MKLIDIILDGFEAVYGGSNEQKETGSLQISLSSLPNTEQALFALFRNGEGCPHDITQAVHTKYIEDGSHIFPFRFNDLIHGNYNLSLMTAPDVNGQYQRIEIAVPKRQKPQRPNKHIENPDLKHCRIPINGTAGNMQLEFLPYKVE